MIYEPFPLFSLFNLYGIKIKLPISIIDIIIGVHHFSSSIQLTIPPLTFNSCTSMEFHDSKPISLTLNETTIINITSLYKEINTISIFLLTSAMFFSIYPITFINLICTIVGIFSMTVFTIPLPFTFISIAVHI